MKTLLVILLFPIAGISQSKTTTVLPTDIYHEYNLYGNRMNMPGTTAPVKISMYCGTPNSKTIMPHVRERVSMDSVETVNHPMVVIDGCEKNYSIMKYLSPSVIESINVLKNASAIEKYGSKAQFGVIEITTKNNPSNTITKAEIIKPVLTQ
jgi:TonB-dependent SusC/RagA subfamily outer membrane receptor